MRTALLGNRDALPPGSITVLDSLGDEQGSKGRYAIAGSIKNHRPLSIGVNHFHCALDSAMDKNTC